MRDRFVESVRSRRARVGVVGLGYVGLPLAVAFAEAGFPVAGFDLDPARVRDVADGRSHVPAVSRAQLAALAGRLTAHDALDAGELARCDAVLICVPTPLGARGQPDLGMVWDAVGRVGRALLGGGGALVVLESTTYPGTTSEALARLESMGLRHGRDFLLAYSPEREDPGTGWTTTRIPKLVGGSPHSQHAAAELYGAMFAAHARGGRVVEVGDPRVAEAAKLVENAYRCVNIALANELKEALEAQGIDVWAVLDAADTKPFGFTRFDPGPGVGGHCIPVDPVYLARWADGGGSRLALVEEALRINGRQPARVARACAAALNSGPGIALAGARVLVLGVAYKPGVGDARGSPALEVFRLLLEARAIVEWHDPHVFPTGFVSPPGAVGRPELTPGLVEGADLVLLLTDHGELDLAMVARHASLVVDTRGVMRGLDCRGVLVDA